MHRNGTGINGAVSFCLIQGHLIGRQRPGRTPIIKAPWVGPSPMVPARPGLAFVAHVAAECGILRLWGDPPQTQQRNGLPRGTARRNRKVPCTGNRTSSRGGV